MGDNNERRNSCEAGVLGVVRQHLCNWVWAIKMLDDYVNGRR